MTARAYGGKVFWHEGAPGEDRFAANLTLEAIARRFDQQPPNPEQEDPAQFYRGADFTIGWLIARIGVLKDGAQ